MNVTGISQVNRAKLSSRNFVRRQQAAGRSPFSCGFRHYLVQQDPTVGLTSKSVVAWPSEEAPGRMCIAAVSDASHSNADVHQAEVRCARRFPQSHAEVYR